jgi:peptidoglycan/LPS O-acetylase OafA/YrhL
MDIRKFAQIDGLRFIAVFGVMCAHWHWFGSDLCELITSGSRGVDLFFVISGFLITLGLIKSKGKAQARQTTLYKFYIRRFLRIFPIYYLTVFILLYFYYDQMAGPIGWYLLYLYNFHCIKVQEWGIAGHLWSLSVEEQFYLVWPFIILFVPLGRLYWVMILSVLLSIGMKVYWHANNYPFWYWYMHPLGALDTLALGGLLAYLYLYYNELLKKLLYNPIIIAFLIIQVIIVMSVRKDPQYGFIHDIGIRTSFGLFSMWLVGRASFGFTGIVGYMLDARPLKYIGQISYSVYLFHVFIPGIMIGFKYPENENLRFIMYFAVTIGLSSLSWYHIERPILKFKERFE